MNGNLRVLSATHRDATAATTSYYYYYCCYYYYYHNYNCRSYW